MGQKINPLGFRLGTTQSHYSCWFAQPKKYSEGLQEDKKIRDYIKNYIQKNMKISSGVERIARIEIKKSIDLIKVIIYTGSEFKEREPQKIKELQLNVQKEKNVQKKKIKELQLNVQKEINCVNQQINIAITKIPNPYGHPKILAEFIAGQLKNRVSFRKAMKKAIDLPDKKYTKGIKVQIAGRLDGKEIARVEWIREGRVPLQTIRAKIDYCSYTVRTIYGVLGIKIWIFLKEQ